MPRSENGIEFTVLLYGIVASNALFRLSYEFSLRNAMLLFAFLVLATDWVEYQLSVQRIATTTRASVLQFALDIAILIVWTFLTVVPSGDVPAFTAILTVFIFLQQLWDRLLYETTYVGLWRSVNWELIAVYGVLLGSYYLSSLPQPLLFGATVVLFVGWKSMTWRQLYAEAEQANETPTI